MLTPNRSKIFQQADKLALQSKIDEGEKNLNEKISNILKQNEIELGSGEKLDFSVDQDGVITVGDGVSEEKRAAIEAALNSNPSLGHELLLSQAQRRFADTGKFMQDGITRNIVIKAYEQYSGDSGYSYTKTSDGKDLTYSFDFSYQDGALVRNDGLSDERIFNNRPDVFNGLAELVGLDDEPTDTASFISSLSDKISKESSELTTKLQGLLMQAGMADVTKKITFAEAEDGSVVVEGNLRADQKRKLEELINDDEELVERIKDQKARMEILSELENSQKGAFPDLNGVPAHQVNEALTEHAKRLKENPYGAFDNYQLDSENLASAREQLLKSYLAKHNVDLDEVAMTTDAEGQSSLVLKDKSGNEKTNEVFQELLAGFNGLGGELKNLLEMKAGQNTSTVKDPSAAKAISIGDSTQAAQETKALLLLKRGVLEEATDEESPDFKTWARSIRSSFTHVGETEEKDGLITKYNKQVGQFDSTMEIVDFTVKVDSNGRMSLVDVKTRGGSDEENRQAEQNINRMMRSQGQDLGNVADFATQLLEYHDDEHGDVEEFKHTTYIDGKGSDGYRIESPEADAAAMAELTELSGKIGSALNEYFKSFEISETFDLLWSSEKGLSLDNAFARSPDGLKVAKVLDQLNERLLSDDPMNDEKFGNSLTPELTGLLDQFLELAEVQDKFHGAAMKKASMTFSVGDRS